VQASDSTSQTDQISQEDCKSPTGTIRRIPSSGLSQVSVPNSAPVSPGMETSEQDQSEEREDKLYSHVAKAGSTPLKAPAGANLGLLPPMTPSSSAYQRQQQYLTAPPSASSARVSRSTSRSRPMQPFTPGFASRQPSYVGGGMKTSRSVSRVRRLDGVASERGDEDSDEDDYAFRKLNQPQTAQRPLFNKSMTTAGPSRRGWDRRNGDNDDNDDDGPLGQDDEVVVRDRGEDLIRKRMRERKKAKRLASASANAAAREARSRDFANPITTSASSPLDRQNDTSFQSYQPDAGYGTSLSSVPPTPALNPNERQSSIGRGKSTSRARTPGPSRATASTPGATGGSSETTGYEYFPPYKGHSSLYPTESTIPQEDEEVISDVTEQTSTPTALEPTVPMVPSSASVSAVDWAYLDRPENARMPRQQHRQPNMSQASRNQSRAPSFMSDVISDVVRGAGSGSRQMSEDGESNGEDDGNGDEIDNQDEEEDEDEDEQDDEDDEGVTMRDRQDVRLILRHPHSHLTTFPGNKYRAPLWSTNLETSTVQEIPFHHAQCRKGDACYPICRSRASSSSRKHPLDTSLRMVAGSNLLCPFNLSLHCRVCNVRWKGQDGRQGRSGLRKDDCRPGLVSRLAVR
jgi:hypothetical protein